MPSQPQTAHLHDTPTPNPKMPEPECLAQCTNYKSLMDCYNNVASLWSKQSQQELVNRKAMCRLIGIPEGAAHTTGMAQLIDHLQAPEWLPFDPTNPPQGPCWWWKNVMDQPCIGIVADYCRVKQEVWFVPSHGHAPAIFGAQGLFYLHIPIPTTPQQ